jgi:hypothetical protein
MQAEHPRSPTIVRDVECDSRERQEESHFGHCCEFGSRSLSPDEPSPEADEQATEKKHSSIIEPARTAFSRAGLTPIRGGVRAASALRSTLACSTDALGGPLVGFKLPAERPALGARGGAGHRHHVESALGEHSLSGGAFCPSLDTRR